MNRTATLVPAIAALVKTEEILGADRTWQPVNYQQRQFIQEYFTKRAELGQFSPQELRSWVDTVAERLNVILRQEGFSSIQLKDFEDDEFGVVAILDVLVEWLVEGEVTTIRTPGKGNYPGVKLANKNGDMPFSVGQSPLHPRPVAMVKTKSGDIVFMTIAGGPESDFDLLAKIRDIESSMHAAVDYDSLTFPMIDLDETVDIGWLLGLKTRDEKSHPWRVSQALQQTKFRMNQKGARAKSAVAIAVARCTSFSPPLRLVIDQPFFLWIKRPGTSVPIFAAYLDETIWKDPGNLDL